MTQCTCMTEIESLRQEVETKFETRLLELRHQIDDAYRPALADLKQRVTTLENKVSTLEGKCDDLQQKNSQLETDIGTIQRNCIDLQQQISDVSKVQVEKLLQSEERVIASHRELHFSNGENADPVGGMIFAIISDPASASPPVVLTKYTGSNQKVALSSAIFWFESGRLRADGSGNYNVYYVQMPNCKH